MNDAKLGAVIDISVIKNDGSLVNYGKYHNVLGQLANKGGTWRRLYMIDPRTFSTYDNTDGVGYGSSTLSGTYYVTGKTLYGINPVSLLTIPNGSLFEFPSGFKCYKTTGTSTFSSCSIGVTGSEPSSIVRLHKTESVGYGISMTSNPLVKQTKLGVISTSPYYTSLSTSGIYSANVSAQFAPTFSPYDIYRITYHDTDFHGGYIDIDPPISLDVGDSLTIRDFKYSITFDVDAPRVFAVSPITGLVGSGKMQRTIPYNRDEYSGNTGHTGVNSRIYLLTDANKVPFLSAMRSTTYTPSVNAKYTIITSPRNKLADIDYNATSLLSAFGAFTSDATPIKQILVGDPSVPPVISCIIEYDTPIAIAAGSRNLTIYSTLKLDVETP